MINENKKFLDVLEAYHMICFFPSGKILMKVNMCSCTECFEGYFDMCLIKKGKLVSNSNDADTDGYQTDSDVEYEDEDNFGDNVEEDMELYEMRSGTVLKVVGPGFVVALFSPVNSLELCYLCRVIALGHATGEDMKTIFKKNAQVAEGSPYLQVQYYEKKADSEFSKTGTVISLDQKACLCTSYPSNVSTM